MVGAQDVLVRRPATWNGGTVASAAMSVEFLVEEGAALAARSIAGVGRATLQNASEELASLSEGAAQADESSKWTLSQFETHLFDSGFTSQAAADPVKAVKIWSNSLGRKFIRQGFSKTGGPTAELFHSGKTSAVAKIRLQTDPSP